MYGSELACRNFVKINKKTMHKMPNFVKEISVFVLKKEAQSAKNMLETQNFLTEIIVFIIKKRCKTPKILRTVFISY